MITKEQYDKLNLVDYMNKLAITRTYNDIKDHQRVFHSFKDKRSVYITHINSLIEKELISDFYDIVSYQSSFAEEKTPMEFIAKEFGLKNNILFEKALLEENKFLPKQDEAIILYFQSWKDAEYGPNFKISHIGFVENGLAISKWDMYAPAIYHKPENVPEHYGAYFTFVKPIFSK